MKKYRLKYNTTKEQIIEMIGKNPGLEVVTSSGSCWWSWWLERWLPYRIPGSSIPCDPLGAPLFQGSAQKFWDAASNDEHFYGRYKLDALVAAFHGNLEVFIEAMQAWRPTAFVGWDLYNEIIQNGGELCLE